MRWLFRAVALATSLHVCAFAAWGQTARPDISDTVLRAAYCVGVLKQNITLLEERQQSRSGCDTNWSALGYKTFEQCLEEKPQIDEVIQALVGDYEEKRKRYGQYLIVRMTDASDGQMNAMLAVVLKGERDATHKEKASDNPLTARCFSSGGNNVFDCVARHDPTHANILRCLHVADQLPF